MKTLRQKLPLILSCFAALTPFTLSAHPGAGIVTDSQGKVYFVRGHSIVQVDATGAARVMAEDVEHRHFHQLHHLFLDAQNNVYTAADTGSGIWKVSPGGQLSRLFPPPNEDRTVLVGLGGDPFALDSGGNIVALNSRQNEFTQLLRITPGGRITVLAGGAWGHADGVSDQARFRDLHGGSMIFGPDGTLFLTDDGSSIRKVTPSGVVSTLAGGTNRGYADGPASQARFDGVHGLAIDAAGNVFAADTWNHRIRKITPQGDTTTFAGSGVSGAADGPASTAQLAQPTGLSFGPGGILYVLEPHLPRVRQITTSGQVSTLLGSFPVK